MIRYKILYECDPEKNKRCQKTACMFNGAPRIRGDCHNTFDRTCARLDGAGQPIVAGVFPEKKTVDLYDAIFGGGK